MQELYLVRVRPAGGASLLIDAGGDDEITLGCVDCRTALNLPASATITVEVSVIDKWGRESRRSQLTVSTPSRTHGRNGRWDRTPWREIPSSLQSALARPGTATATASVTAVVVDRRWLLAAALLLSIGAGVMVVQLRRRRRV